MEEIKKEDCQCDNLAIVKKGFSGEKAILGFVISVLSCVFILWLVFNIQKNDADVQASVDNLTHMTSEAVNYGFIDTILISVASIVSLLGLFWGTNGMNDLKTVCPKCGEVKDLIPKK